MPNLIKMPHEIQFNDRLSILIYGSPGCLHGDTEITCKIGNEIGSKKKKIKDLFRYQDGIPYRGWKISIRKSKEIFVRSLNENTNEFMWSKAILYFSGRKECFEIMTSNGKSIITSLDHPFLTPNGWKKMSELSVGDKVMFNPCKNTSFGKKKQVSLKEFFVKYHPRNRIKIVHDKKTGWDYIYNRVYLHHAVYEANMNGMNLTDYISLLNNYDGRDIWFVPKGMEIDHIDGNRLNNEISNLQMLSKSEHAKKTMNTAEMKLKILPEECCITSKLSVGEHDTYDISCISENHNFCANDFIVHNSGKSSLALSMPKPVLLDTDRGIHRVNFGHHAPTVQVNSYADVQAFMQENLDPFDTVIVDTGGKLLDFMGDYVIGLDPKNKAGAGLSLKGFGARKNEFRAFKNALQLKGKHVVFVAHRDTLKEGDDYRFVPLFGGSSYDDLSGDLDLILYLELEGKNRILTADPTSRNDGKNTCNLPNKMPLPVILNEDGSAASNTFMQKSVIAPHKVYLERANSQSQAFHTLIADATAQISLITDEVGCNAFISHIGDFQHIGSSRARMAHILHAKATELGLVLNTAVEPRVYERPQTS